MCGSESAREGNQSALLNHDQPHRFFATNITVQFAIVNTSVV